MDSTYEIDFDALYREGYRGIIFDIDNTLVPHGAPAKTQHKAGAAPAWIFKGTKGFLYV